MRKLLPRVMIVLEQAPLATLCHRLLQVFDVFLKIPLSLVIQAVSQRLWIGHTQRIHIWREKKRGILSL